MITLNTSGDGYWSLLQTAVKITDIKISYLNDEEDFGELRVYFDPSSWAVEHDGLIYTDRQFIQELKQFLTQHGLSTDISYSEQGMQGDDYVSLDIEDKFIQSWYAKFNTHTV